MIAMLARRLALTFLVALFVVALLEQFNPAPPPMLVDFHRADFPVCAIVHNGPTERPDHYGNPHRRRSDDA